MVNNGPIKTSQFIFFCFLKYSIYLGYIDSSVIFLMTITWKTNYGTDLIWKNLRKSVILELFYVYRTTDYNLAKRLENNIICKNIKQRNKLKNITGKWASQYGYNTQSPRQWKNHRNHWPWVLYVLRCNVCVLHTWQNKIQCKDGLDMVTERNQDYVNAWIGNQNLEYLEGNEEF